MENIISFIISITIISSTFINSNYSNGLNIYNKIVDENYSIVEQGVQGKYLSRNSIDEEIKKIKDTFNIKGQFEKNNNCFSFNYKEHVMELNIFAIEEKSGINVEIVIKKSSKVNEIDVLEDSLKKVNDSMKISSYLKSKVNNNLGVNNNLNNLEKKISTLSFDHIERVSIDSGFTGMAKNNKGSQLNYSIVSYGENETYMIIGTPVIFITY